jgi:hypothetical protein
VRRGPTGIAHLRGRVLFPDGRQSTDDVEVVADDGARTIAAQVTKKDRFQIHLPAGRYTLIATAGELVGVVPDVVARDGESDVDIRLAIGATIRGRISAPEGADVDLDVTRAGGRKEAGVATVEDGAFVVAGLIPGRRYDLRFHGATARTLNVTGVEAPADRVDVALDPRANVRGSIGFPPGTDCPISRVHLQSGQHLDDDDDDDHERDDDTSADVGSDCAFALSVPDQAPVVTIVATGEGWHLEEQVAIPAHGDPEPICLNPPCRNDPQDGRARLRVTLDNVSAGPINATAAPSDESSETGGGYHACGSSTESCDITELTPGETLSVSASGADCLAEAVMVTVVAGDNYLRLPCRRQRRVEGMVRISDSEQPEPVSVRCAGGAGRALHGTRLFRLTCAVDVDAVEFQIGEAGRWRSVPIASAADPALVEIGP